LKSYSLLKNKTPKYSSRGLYTENNFIF